MLKQGVQTRGKAKTSLYEDTQAGRQGEAECPEKLCRLQPWRFSRQEWIAQYNSTGYAKKMDGAFKIRKTITTATFKRDLI